MGVNSDVDDFSPPEVCEEQNGNQFTFGVLSEGKDDDVDDDDLQRFGQTNHMMQRVQEALRSQLQRTQERVKNELLQQEEVLRKLRLEREEMGLKLFMLQQQLDQVDSNFQKANEMYHSLLTSREEHDALIHQHKLTLENCTKEARELDAQNALAQTELHRSHLAAAQAKDLNETLKGDISVAKRVAQKTEQDIKELEKGKNTQDLHILHLKERIHPLEEDIDLTTQQLQSQKSQTSALKQMIKETTAEFDALGVDTKQILQQWKTSLVALQLRDEGLMEAKAALKAIQDEVKEIATELNHSQREVVTQTQRNAELVTASIRQENEAKYLEGLNTAIQSEQDVMAQKYEEINKSIVGTNFEENRLLMDIRKLRTDIATIEQKIKLVESESTRLEQMVDFNICEQTTFLKTAKSMEEQGKGILSRLHENEMIASKARNELARINMEKLNVQQNISQLKNSLQEHLGKLKSIDLILLANEAEIKRNNSEINKNMNNIDKLNRKYQKILEGAEEGEPVGPLEATIKSLSKNVDEQEAHASQAQKDIDANEAALIDVVTEVELIHERITTMQAKLNVLNHKRLRLEQETHTNEVTTTSLRVNIQRIHTCMPRLNDLIKQSSRRQSQLCSEFSIKERELMRASKDFELENSNLLVKITETKASKNKILSELVEVEHKLLSWERSIQLEKETQATLKSLKEESDIVCMEKEIHRMKYKLVQLNRKQEFMVRDMERAIARREDIAVKYSKSCKTKRSNISSKTSSRTVSCVGFEQMILNLKRELESVVKESNECSNKIKETSKDIDRITRELEKTKSKEE